MSLAFVHQDKHTAARCNKLQHTATHCSTLQGTAANCNTLQQHTATHCNTLQHTATLCRHTATATHCRQTHVYSATHCRQTHVYSGLHQDKFASSVPFAGLLAGLKLAGLSPAIQQGSRQHPRQEPLNKKCPAKVQTPQFLPARFGVFVKHNIYILPHAWSPTVRLLHSWAESKLPDSFQLASVFCGRPCRNGKVFNNSSIRHFREPDASLLDQTAKEQREVACLQATRLRGTYCYRVTPSARNHGTQLRKYVVICRLRKRKKNDLQTQKEKGKMM